MTRTIARTGEERPSERASPRAGLPAGGRGDASPIIRQGALLAAAVTAWLLRSHLGAGNEVLWVLGFVALANALAFAASSRGLGASAATALSLGTGVAGWLALIHVTGGHRSPFIAGLGLEVVVAASLFGTRVAAWVLPLAIAGLWAQQAILGLEGAVAVMALQSLLLAATGVAVALIRSRWALAHDRAWEEAERSRRRLVRLQDRLEDLQVVEEAGDHAVRLAHGLKNAVGSLRGFTGLIQRRMDGSPADLRLLEGLDSSVRRLEEIAGLIMGPPPEEGSGTESRRPVAPGKILREAVAQARVKHPGVRWVLEGEQGTPPVVFLPGALVEILEVLLDNAAEAMGGGGEVRVRAVARDGAVQIEVRDQGCGIPADRLESLFRPGRTSKRRGSGFGLFVARKLAESQGGRLEVAAGAGGPGTSFLVTVPVGGER